MMFGYPGEEAAEEGGSSLEGAFAKRGEALDERLSHLLNSTTSARRSTQRRSGSWSRRRGCAEYCPDSADLPGRGRVSIGYRLPVLRMPKSDLYEPHVTMPDSWTDSRRCVYVHTIRVRGSAQ